MTSETATVKVVMYENCSHSDEIDTRFLAGDITKKNSDSSGINRMVLS